VKPIEVIGIVLRGMAMGAADVMPGVSGGTIAFVTGIYPRLITSLTSFNFNVLSLVLQLKITEAWRQVDANFLLSLFAGILCSIYLFSHLVAYAFESYPVLLWSFFFGLITASVVVMLMELGRLRLPEILSLIAGVAFVFLISISPAGNLSPLPLLVFLAGFIAISAMLLPGVSGAFLLLLMGLYTPTIDAVRNLDLVYITIFASGAALGFLVFSRLIKWLLTRFYRPTLLFLIGLLVGSLYVVWPWKSVDTEVSQNLSPSSYAFDVGDPMILWARLAMVVGAAIILSFELLFGKQSTEMETS